MCECKSHDISPSSCIEFVHESVTVGFGGLDTDVELGGNLSISKTLN